MLKPSCGYVEMGMDVSLSTSCARIPKLESNTESILLEELAFA